MSEPQAPPANPPEPVPETVLSHVETVRDVRQARLTGVMKLYHSPAEGEASECSHSWTLWLETDEQPWGPRHVQVGPEWVPLPDGWGGEFAAQAAAVVLFNREGTFRTVTPTPEEREAARAKVVEVGVATVWPDGLEATDTVEPFACVRPLTSQPIQLPPGGLGRLRLRCPAGKARVSVTIFPG